MSLKNELGVLLQQESNMRDSIAREEASTNALANQIGQQQDLMAERSQAVKKLSNLLEIDFDESK
jgi:hypothetical protein